MKTQLLFIFALFLTVCIAAIPASQMLCSVDDSNANARLVCYNLELEPILFDEETECTTRDERILRCERNLSDVLLLSNDSIDTSLADGLDDYVLT